MNRIIGKPFNSICRIVDLLGLYFGDDVQVELSRGLQQKPQFSLHIQTQWRFRKDERILLASRDIYTPFDPSADADWRFDIVGREPAQSSVFDATKDTFAQMMGGSTVTDYTIAPWGDITVRFSNGVLFEAFVSGSVPDEEWRFFAIEDTDHVVFHELQEYPAHNKNQQKWFACATEEAARRLHSGRSDCE